MNPTAELHRLSLQSLERHVRAASAQYELEDGEIRLANGHHVGLAISFDDFIKQGDQTLAPVEWQMYVDSSGDDKLPAGAIGVGADEQAALESAVGEWYTLFATPVLNALGAQVSRRRSQASQRIVDWEMFAGQAGFRGTVPPDLVGDGPLFRAILFALRDEVGTWPTADHWQMRSVFLMVSVEQQAVDIQAAVDGDLQPALSQRLGKLDWPPSDAAYLYKQMFVFRHGEK